MTSSRLNTRRTHFSHLGEISSVPVSSKKKKAEKEDWTKHIIADSLPFQSTVIIPIKHILYINNNRQLKWVLCQCVLVTQYAKEHTPCACGIVSSTPAIESFVRGSKLVRQTSSNQLKHLLTRWLRLMSSNRARYAGTEPTCARTGRVFLSTSWCVLLNNLGETLAFRSLVVPAWMLFSESARSLWTTQIKKGNKSAHTTRMWHLYELLVKLLSGGTRDSPKAHRKYGSLQKWITVVWKI